MDGADLVDRYKRYKSGTTKIFDYTVDATPKFPEFATILPSLHAANKAVKQAKKRPDRVSATDLQVTVTTSKLVKLAGLIVKHGKLIPKSIATLLADVIKGRKECAAWYEKVEESPNDQSKLDNEGHQHFIVILEQVRELLLPCIEASDSSEQPKPNPTRDDTSMENTFSALELEEPSASPLGAEPDKYQPKVTFKLQHSEGEEKTFAIWCFLQDMYELRQSIKKIWADYAAGRITFAAASLTTDTSFAIVRLSEERFLETYPELRHFGNILDWMHMTVYSLGQTCLLSPKCLDRLPSLAGPPSRRSGDIIAELFSPHAFLALTGFRESITLEYEDMTKNETLLAHLRVHYFAHRVLPCVKKDIEMIFHGYAQKVVLDDFMRGLIDVARFGVIPSWLVFACQVYLDIFDTIYSEDSGGFRDFQRISAQAQKDDMLFQNMPDRHLFEEYRGIARTIADDFEATKIFVLSCLNDPILEGHMALKENNPDWDTTGIRKHRLPNILPLYGGHVAFKIQERTHTNGIFLCNHDDVVVSLAYLYRACVQAALLSDSSWTDMDFIIANHSRKKPLVLERKHDIGCMGKFFGMKLGISRQAYDKDKKAALPTRTMGKVYLEPSCPLFKDHAQGEKSPISGYKHKVAVAIDCIALSRQATSTDSQCSLLQLPKHSPKSKISSYHPTQLLNAFKDAFQAWEPELNFDHMEFFISCKALVESIRAACSNYFKHHQPSTAQWWAFRSADLTYAILMDAADENIGEHKQIKSQALRKASKVLADHIERYGSKFKVAAIEKSTGQVLVDELIENHPAKFKIEWSKHMIELLRQWDCPFPLSPSTVFCRTRAEIDERKLVFQALQKITTTSEVGEAVVFRLPDDSMELLKILEAPATRSVQRMNPGEITENLKLFEKVFLGDVVFPNIEAEQLTGFMYRVYTGSVRQVQRAREMTSR